MKSFTRQEKILLFMLAFIQSSHIIDFMIMMPLGPQLMRIFQITPREFGVLVSVYTFAAGTSGIFAAFFMDKFDRKHSLLFFYVGFCLGTIACGLSPNYYFLLAARTLTGAFGGVLGSLVMSIVGDAISPQRRGSAMGIVMTSFSISSIMGVPFSLYLANRFDWHAPFLLLGVVSFILTFVIIYFIPSVRKHLDEPSGQKPLALVLSVLQGSSTRTALMFMFVLMLGHFSIIPFLSPTLVANAKLTESQLPLIYFVGGCCSIVFSPIVGWLSDQYGRFRILWISVLSSFVPVLLITHLGPTPIALILFYIAIFFICGSGRFAPAMAMVTSTVTPQRRGTFMSLNSCVQNFSAALGSYIAGMIVAQGANGEILNYNIVGYFSVILSFLALVLARRVKMVE